MSAPYQIKKCDLRDTPYNKGKFFALVDTRKNVVIETDESRECLEEKLTNMSTDWLFDNYT